MTIAIGLLADSGVVLAADTQLTYAINKSSGGKVMGLSKSGQRALALTGATDRYGHMVSLVQKVADAFEQLPDDARKANVRDECENVVTHFHMQHVAPYHDPATMDLLIAYQGEDGVGLWRTERSAFAEVYDAGAVGIGASVAGGLIDRLWQPGLDVQTATALAVYIVAVVKASIDGCGLRTQAMIIEERTHYLVPQALTDQIDDLSRHLSVDVEPSLIRPFFGLPAEDGEASTADKARQRMSALIKELRKMRPLRVNLLRASRTLQAQRKADPTPTKVRKKAQPPWRE